MSNVKVNIYTLPLPTKDGLKNAQLVIAKSEIAGMTDFEIKENSGAASRALIDYLSENFPNDLDVDEGGDYQIVNGESYPHADVSIGIVGFKKLDFSQIDMMTFVRQMGY